MHMAAPRQPHGVGGRSRAVWDDCGLTVTRHRPPQPATPTARSNPQTLLARIPTPGWKRQHRLVDTSITRNPRGGGFAMQPKRRCTPAPCCRPASAIDSGWRSMSLFGGCGNEPGPVRGLALVASCWKTRVSQKGSVDARFIDACMHDLPPNRTAHDAAPTLASLQQDRRAASGSDASC
ncbi:hypothetical protein K505DRAFT_343147 [Melanomma pulvis-pyrius CBS 109.77]|uniref:Uncharacterized protein n=1 Tax=Melanomma pulvis-pyrius CBS 109.77 TaxID=1314802 RepID=A0A6A6WTK2_9PLEO|nr:hypothetical protein K505DRAFT_343147 [Melanomma pulvis-pyrius CBS 109.77]